MIKVLFLRLKEKLFTFGNQKLLVLLVTSFSGLLFSVLAIIVLLAVFAPRTLSEQVVRKLPFLTLVNRDLGQVLQASTINQLPILSGEIEFNLPSVFNDNVFIDANASVSGTFTAPNILYGIIAGDNITITEGQTPTISAALEVVAGDGITITDDTIANDDPGSAQNIFKNIKVGSTTISAGSNDDTFELAAGNNITLSTDTSNKKITIEASGSSDGISGIEIAENGTTVVTTATVLDFLGGDFDVTESPSGEGNVQLAGTLTSVTGVSGAFTVGSTFTLSGDTISDFTGTNSGIEIASGTLTLLTSCDDNEILKYTDATGWACASDAGGGGSVGGTGVANRVAFWEDPSTLSSNADFYWDNTNELLGIGTNGSPVGKLDVQGAVTGKALVILNETGGQNILTASSSGTTVFTIASDGSLAIEGALSDLSNTTLTINDTLSLSSGSTYQINGTDVLSATSLGTNVTSSSLTSVGTLTSGTWNASIIGAQYGGTGLDASTASNGQILIGNGAGFSLATLSPGTGISISNGSGTITISQSESGLSKWTQNDTLGILSPNLTTLDLLVGGNSTASAKFAVLNVAGTTPIASLSGQLGGMYLTASGQIRTTNKQSLTLGGGDTGEIVLSGFGTGIIHSTNGVLSASAVDLASADVTGVLPVANGGTGVNTFGGTNTILYTTAADTLAAITTGNNGVLVTNGSGVPSISSTLPNAVQDNITRLGTVTSGTWNANTIGAQYGGTGIDTSGSTGVPSINGGTWSVNAQLPLSLGGTNANLTAVQGGIVYSGASAFAISAAGTAGQALISGGTGSPTWFAPTAGSIIFAGTSGILQQDNASFFFDDTNNRLGLGVNSNLAATLDVRGTSGTLPVSSISGRTSFASLIVDNAGVGDIFTASSSGLPRFVVSQTGNLQFTGNTSFLHTLTSSAAEGKTYNLPDFVAASADICLSSGNCVGVGGSGDVLGPGSSTDHALVRFNGTTGKSIQNSGIIIDDSNNMTGVNSLSILPASNITGLTLTGTNVTSGPLAYFNALNSSGTIFEISYGSSQTLTGSLIGQEIDLNDGQLTATNQNVTGQKITLPTVTNTNAAGTQSLLGLQVTFGEGAGINQNGAGATVFSNLDVQLPALTQTAGSLTANGLAVTTPSSITTGGVANGLLISPTGIGAGTLNGVNIATISAAGNGNETAINIGTNWDTVLRVNGTPVINGQGVTLATGGGTGQSSYATGDILYASATNTLSKLTIGNSDDYVLKVSGGVPVWGTISGSSCSTCLITNPSSTATNTIEPTGQDTTGLVVRQTSTGSPTNDIFQVTNAAGDQIYFRVDEDGNVHPSSTIGTTLTLTPTTDTTALTLIGTNVTTADLQYINANNQEGNIFNINYGASQTLSTSTPLNAIAVDLSTNVTATNANVTGTNLTLPGTTNTHTSGTKELTGVSVSAGGGINQNGAGGTTTFAAFDATIPALTQTAGTLNAYGLTVTTPSSITTGGTAAALNVSASGVGAGTLYGLNISGITAGSGIETALAIGSGWDNILDVNGTIVIDGSGNLNVANAIGILPVANGGSPFEQNLGAIFPRISTQDLLIGGTASQSARFHAYGSVNAGTTPSASVAASSTFAGLVVDNTRGDIFTASSSGLTRFVIKQNGNIGVGITTPAALVNAVSGISDFRFSTGAGGETPTISTINNDASGKAAALAAGTDGAIFAFDENGWFGIQTDSKSNFLSNNIGDGTDVFRILGNGNVGIGPTDPDSRLDITSNSNADDALIQQWRYNTGSDAENYFLELKQTVTSGVVRWNFSQRNNNVPYYDVLVMDRGNVGLGTVNPLATLDVRGRTGTTPFASMSGQTSFAGLVVDNSGSGDIFTASSSGLNRFVIKQDGNVGIGTDNPVSKLHVDQGNLTLANTASGTTDDPTSFIEFVETGWPDRFAILADFNGFGDDNKIGITANGSSNFPGWADAKFTMLQSGRIGLSTISPLATLDVRPNTTNGATIAIASISGRTSFAGLAVDNSHGDLFTASSSGLTRFVINQGGNVGIGTTNPLAKLHINTNTLAGGVSQAGIEVNVMNNNPIISTNSALAQQLLNNQTPSESVTLMGNFQAGNFLVGQYNDNTGSFDGITSQDYDIYFGTFYNNWANPSGAPTSGSYIKTRSNEEIEFFVGSGNPQMRFDGWGLTINANGSAGSPRANLDVLGITTGGINQGFVASISGKTGKAALLVDNASNIGDLFTASASGLTRFVIKHNGNVGIGTPLPTRALDVVGTINASTDLTVNGTSVCLQNGTNCPAGNINYWVQPSATGILRPANATLDLIIGGVSSASAKFHVYGSANLSGTQPVASVSGNTAQAAFIIDNRVGDLFTASSSGLPRFVIKNNGNIGIGTNTPGTFLEVVGDNNTENVATFWAGDNWDSTITIGSPNAPGSEQYITYRNITTGSDAWMVGMGDDEKFKFYYGTAGEIDDDNPFMTIDQTGYVGINGVTGPSEPLDVYGNIAFHYTFGIKALDHEYDNVLTTGWDDDISNDFVSFYTPGGNPANEDPKMTLLMNGNVGIGTTQPDENLEVTSDGDTRIRIATTGTTGQEPGLEFFSDGANAGSRNWLIGTEISDWGTFQIWSSDAQNGDPQSAGSPRLTIDRNSLFGIGTTTPRASLDVRGSTTAGGTIPVASLSARTSFAGLVVDNSGRGDLFAASASGLTRFVITNSGRVGINTTDTNDAILTVKSDGVRGFHFVNSSDSVSAGITNNGAMFLASSTTFGAVLNISTGSSSGIGQRIRGVSGQTGDLFQLQNAGGADTFVRFDANGALQIANLVGTVPAASISARTSFPALAVDNSGTGDIFTASSSGLTRFIIANNGDVTTRGTSTEAFKIQNAAGTSTFLSVDSVNSILNLLPNNNAQTLSWNTAADLPVAKDEPAVTYSSGYIYVMGGWNGTSTVYYGAPDINGNVRSWATTNSLSQGVADAFAATSYNDYVYVLGGSTDGDNAVTTVQYARVQPDGSLSTWSTTSPLPAGRKEGAAVVYNGYMYYIGGNSNTSGGDTASSTVYYAKINSDGSLGSWTSTGSGLGARISIRATVANGFIYALGGHNNSETYQDDVYYIKPNSDGTLGTWSTTQLLPQNESEGGVASFNGYLYYVSNDNDVSYAQLNANGTVSSWSMQAGGVPSITTFGFASSPTAMYIVGGWNGSDSANVYYTTFGSVRVASGLDLTISSGEILASGSAAAGYLRAGNTEIAGTLSVMSNATFSDGLSVRNIAIMGNGLTVMDSQTATSAAMIYNRDTGTDADGLAIKLGFTNANNNNHFIDFLDGLGRKRGNIRANGTGVQFQTSGIADFAEYIKKNDGETFDYGDIICLTDQGKATKCNTNDTGDIIGVMSDTAVISGGDEEDAIPVGLVGVVRTTVSTINGNIKAGDPITVSPLPGVGMKATKTGKIVGRALEGYNGSSPQRIHVVIQPGWYDPDVYLTDTGNISIFEKDGAPALNSASTYSVSMPDGSEVIRTGVFSDAVIGNLKSGSLDVQTLSLGGQNLNDRLLGLESGVASFSAGIMSPLESLTSQLSSLNSRIASLEAQLQLLTTNDQPLSDFDASSSAELSLDSLEVNGNILAGSLNVLGYTTMNELSVTGSIRTGILTIKGQSNGGASIGTLNGDLRLQDEGFGGIDILDGKVTIDTSGNIETEGTLTAKTVETDKLNIGTDSVLSASAGSVTIEAGDTTLDVTTTALTPDSLIFVSPDSPVLVGAKKKNATTFTIRLNQAQTTDVKVNWWIVN